MAGFRAEFDVDAPPEEVRAYLRDPVNRVDWDPSVRSFDGSTLTVGFYGRAVEVDYRLVDDEPTRLVFTFEGKVDGRDTFELEPTDTGTAVVMDTEVRLKGIARLLDRGLGLALGGIGENAARGLAKALGRKALGRRRAG